MLILIFLKKYSCIVPLCSEERWNSQPLVGMRVDETKKNNVVMFLTTTIMT